RHPTRDGALAAPSGHARDARRAGSGRASDPLERKAVGITALDDFARHLAAWLTADAPTSEPEHLLGEVLARTARTRRRPAWRIPERWISMSAITSRVTTPPRVPWRTIALAALLVALIASALFVAGSLRHR